MNNVQINRTKRSRRKRLVAVSLSALLVTTFLSDANAQSYSGSYPAPDMPRPGSSLSHTSNNQELAANIDITPSARMLPDSAYSDRRRRGREVFLPAGESPFESELKMSDSSMRVMGFAKPLRTVNTKATSHTDRIVTAAGSYAALEPAAGDATANPSATATLPLEAIELPPPEDKNTLPSTGSVSALPIPGAPAPVASADATASNTLPPLNSFLQSDKAVEVVPAAPALALDQKPDSPAALAAVPLDALPTTLPILESKSSVSDGVKVSALKASADKSTAAKSEKIVDPTIDLNAVAAAPPPPIETTMPELKLDSATVSPALPPVLAIPSVALPSATDASKAATAELTLPAASDTQKMGTVTISSSVPSIAQALEKPVSPASELPKLEALTLEPVAAPTTAPEKLPSAANALPPELAKLPTLPTDGNAASTATTVLPLALPTATTDNTQVLPAPDAVLPADAKPEEVKPEDSKPESVAASSPESSDPKPDEAKTEVAKAKKNNENEASDTAQKPYKVFGENSKGTVIDRAKKPDDRLIPSDVDIIKEHKDVGINIAVRRPSQRSDNQLELAYDALIEGHPEDAIKIYREILDNSPANRNALFGLATTYQKLGRVDEAKPYYQKLLAIDPSNKEALNNYLVLVAEDAPQEAIAQLEGLEEDNPRYSPIIAQLALMYQKEGRNALALQKMVKAASLSPNNTTYLYNLAVMYDKEGVWQQAAGLYQQLVDASERGEKIPARSSEIQERLTFIRSNSSNKLM